MGATSEHHNVSSLIEAALAIGDVSSGTLNVDVLDIPSLYSIVAAAVKKDMMKTGVNFSNFGFVQALSVTPDLLQASLVLSGIVVYAS